MQAAGSNAPDWLVSQYILPRWKIRTPATWPFLKILWPHGLLLLLAHPYISVGVHTSYGCWRLSSSSVTLTDAT